MRTSSWSFRPQKFLTLRIFVSLIIYLLLGNTRIFSVEASSGSTTLSRADQVPQPLSPTTRSSTIDAMDDDDIRIVFSDLDGTLIHYPEDVPAGASSSSEKGNTILKLPPSSTGMKGIISSKTLSQCRDLRRQGVKLVLVSGMRTETLLKRLPYLPRADAYCTEAGGRIFYSIQDNDDKSSSSDGFRCTPVAYDGAAASDLRPFGLREDMEWRLLMEQEVAAGKDGYRGHEIEQQQSGDDDVAVVPVGNRKGALWAYATKLEQAGFAIDTKGYASCFRVNRKHQQPTATGTEMFEALLQGDSTVVPNLPRGLATSTNLGCIDFYPVHSGKKNCCAYLAQKFGNGEQDTTTLSRRSVCICDDDNDIEMALACSHTYIPALSSDSMKATIEANPSKFTTVFGPGRSETSATEEALRLILQRVVQTTPK